MSDRESTVQIFISKIFKKILEEEPEDLLTKKFEEKGLRLPEQIFLNEYRACCLALASHAWEFAVRDNLNTIRMGEKLFFKSVMAGFDSPQKIALASAFSDYYCQMRLPTDSSLSVVLGTRFCERVTLAKPPKEILESVAGTVIEILEGLRVTFENQFDSYLISLIKL